MAKPVTKATPERKPRQRTSLPKGASWHGAFLADLAENCNVNNAARFAGIDRVTAYRHRESNPEFAALWDDAIEAGIQALELAARKRAMTVSDTLAIFLLKSHRPDTYRENKRTELTGANGGPVETRILFGYDDGVNPMEDTGGHDE